MYELRKGTMMLLTPSKKDVEMYKKAGWQFVEKRKKTKQETIKSEINKIVDQVINEEFIEK